MSAILENLREKYPAYGEIPDDELAIALGQKYPQYLKADDQFASEFNDALRRQRRGAVEEFKADVPAISGTTFGRGLASGGLMMGEGVARFGEVLLSPFGDTAPKRSLREIGDELAAQRAAIPFEVQSIRDVQGPGDVAQFATKAIGEVTPQVAAMFVPGGIAARLSASPRLAAALGAGSVALPLETGHIFEEVRQETGQERPGLALGAGTLAGSLEVLMPAKLIGKALDNLSGPAKRNLWRRVVSETAKTAAESAVIEAPTEALQESISIAAVKIADETYDAVNSENAWRTLDASLMGLFGGGAFGGAVGGLTAARRGEPVRPTARTGPPPPSQPSGAPPPPAPAMLDAEVIDSRQRARADFETALWNAIGEETAKRRSPVPRGTRAERGTPDAQRIPTPAQLPSLVREPEVPPESPAPLPPAGSGPGIPPSRPGEEVATAPPAQGTVKPEEADTRYPKVRDVVDGRSVLPDVPNTSSIGSSLTDWEALPGIREVPVSEFTLSGKHYSPDGQKRIDQLVAAISQSNEIAPLIVVIDKDGPYILEGATRAEALFKMGAKSFPALVVIDKESFATDEPPPAQRPIAPAEFIGWQQIPGRPSLPMFRLTADLNERQKAGSTVMGPTLEAAGFSLPPLPPETPTPVQTPPAPVQTPAPPTIEQEVTPDEGIQERPEEEREGVLAPPVAPPPVEPTPEAAAEPSEPPKKPTSAKWYEQLPEPQRESVFATMRAIRQRSDEFLQRERQLRPPTGSIAAGATGFDEFIRGEAIAVFLREIGRGKTPEAAEAATKAFTEDAVKTHNKKRPKDKNWARSPGTADSDIGRVRMEIEDAAAVAQEQAEEGGSTLLSRAPIGWAETGATARVADPYKAFLRGQPSTSEILKEIETKSAAPFRRRLAARLRALKIDPPIRLVPRSEIESAMPGDKGKTAQGGYNPDKHFIWIAEDAAYTEEVLLHELTHAATVAALRKGGPAAQEIRAIFAEAAKEPALAEFYGMTDVDEFLVEAQTNEGFRNALAKIGQPLSLWERLVRAIRKLLGLDVKDTNLLERVLRVSDPLITSERPAPGASATLASQLDPFESRQTLERFVRQKTVSPEVEQEMRTVAGAQAGLVSDTIMGRIASIDVTQPIGQRQRALLDFVVALRNLAPVQQIQAILASNMPEDVKTAAVSTVMRQAEHVRNKARDFGIESEKATAELKRLARLGKRYTAKEIEKDSAQQTAEELLTAYQGYLTAQGRTLPADRNIAAERQRIIDGMARVVAGWQKTPAAIQRAVELIAENAGILPMTRSPAVIAKAVRDLKILDGKVSQDVIDLMTLEQPGGIAPALATPEIIATLRDLARLRTQSNAMATKLAELEALFAGDPTPISLRKWAREYARWRNKERDAARLLRRMDREFEAADADLEVYNGAIDILEALQKDPQFLAVFNAALDSGDVLYSDLAKADARTRETLYVGPISGREYRVDLRPDKIHETATLVQMDELLTEVDKFLEQPDIDPVIARGWERRRDYIRQFVYFPQFGQVVRGLEFPLKVMGREWLVNLNPFEFANNMFFGGRMKAARPELELMDFRAAKAAQNTYRLADFISQKMRQLRNDKVIGDAAQTIAINRALASHGWAPERTEYWNRYVLNEILASGQNIGQLRYKEGNLVNGIQITKEDMEVARLQKRYTNRALAITQSGAHQTPLQFFNPLQIQSQFSNLRVSRNAFGLGPMTMARLPGKWGRGFADQWAEAKTTGAKLNLIRDGDGFFGAVMGLARETNLEFEARPKSPLQKAYNELADLAKDDQAYNFRSLDPMVNWLTTKTNQTADEVQEQLIKEIDAYVADYNEGLAEEAAKAETKTPEAAAEVASAKNAFTTPRQRLRAPSTFYDYTLSQDTDRTSYLAGGYQIYQLAQIHALKDLQAGLKRKQAEFETRIDAEYERGLNRRAAIRKVQLESIQEVKRQETRFNYKRLLNYIGTIEKIEKDLTEMVIDQRTPFDGFVLYAISRGQSTLSSALLGNPQAISTNVLGGAVVSQFLFHQRLGRANLLLSPLRSTKEGVSALMTRLLSLAPAQTVVGKAIRSNIPGFRKLIQWVAEQQAESIQQYAEAYDAGLVNPADTKGRSQAAGELKRAAGRVEFMEPGGATALFNLLESQPGMRRFLIELRDKSPRVFDDMINLSAMSNTRKNIFDRLKKEAISAFQAREKLGKSNDFTQEQNLLEPGELGFTQINSHRVLAATRELFGSVGSLDNLLLNYYTRWNAEPFNDRHAVPLFEDPAHELGVLFDATAATNLPTAGYTPSIMQGIGYKGAVKGLLFMFQNFPVRFAAQMGLMLAKHQNDRQFMRTANGLYAAGALVVLMALFGMFAREIGQETLETVTGRSTGQLRLANLLETPEAYTAARLAGIAMSSNFPYYGEMISRILGNPAYGSFADVTEIVPVLGMIKDAAQTGKRIVETGSALYPATDFMSRWFPPINPVLRLVPELAGDLAVKNAGRALTATAPREMELVRERFQGGAFRQTPASATLRSLLSAAYRGDALGIRAAFQTATRQRAEAGSTDPEKSVLQSLAAMTPSRRAFGRNITDAEESRLIGRMSQRQRTDYGAAKVAFGLINEVLGSQLRLVAAPEQPTVARSRAGIRRTRRPTFYRGFAASPFERRRRRSPTFAFSE